MPPAMDNNNNNNNNKSNGGDLTPDRITLFGSNRTIEEELQDQAAALSSVDGSPRFDQVEQSTVAHILEEALRLVQATIPLLRNLPSSPDVEENEDDTILDPVADDTILHPVEDGSGDKEEEKDQDNAIPEAKPPQ